MNILVVTTGGTIGAMPYEDPLHPPEFITVPPNNRDIVRETLESSGKTNIRTINAGLRESKLIDEPYRLNLVRQIADAPENRILITHGTDALIQTAEFLLKKFRELPYLRDKVIVLTGAMTPILNGLESDGYQNLNFSVEYLTRQDIKAGVYIVLCDYESSEPQTGWTPRLYPFQSGRYKKLYNPADGRYHRLQEI